QSVLKDTGRVFRVLYTNSYDNGTTWEKPLPLGIDGSPAHLMRHSSGAIICTYGYRELDFLKEKNTGSGQRAIISYDDGKTWTKPYIISDHIDTYDIGYPSTVELFDGSLYTVYYQRESREHHPGLLYSKWDLPE
ncbi:MAG: exo-alpha-sialidase, partial [Clostridia bacterium]|nr:exo-alpha-sialidase [Clostridia bacterium]